MKNNKLHDIEDEVTQQLFEEGNSSEKQLTLLAEISQKSGLKIISANNLSEAAKKIIKAAK